MCALVGVPIKWLCEVHGATVKMIFLFVLVPGILCTWPNQLSLWALIWLAIFLCFISLSNSSLVLILHIWFSFIGPNILLKIFLSKTSNFWIMVSFSTHVSEAYIAIGFMTVLYNFNFEALSDFTMNYISQMPMFICKDDAALAC